MTDATMQPDEHQSNRQPLHALIPATPAVKRTGKLYLFKSILPGCGRVSVAGIVIQPRSAVTQLRLCREGKQEQNVRFDPLAARSSLAAVTARCSSAQVMKQLTGLRAHPSRRRKRSLEAAAGDDAAAAAAFAPSRRGMREAVGVGVGAAEDPRRNAQKYTHRTRNRRLTSKRWLMNHYAH